MSNSVATAEQPRRSILATMASRFDMEPGAFEATLRGTVLKKDKDGNEATREEFAAFLVVANEYRLNPLTKEIYAFFDRQKGGVVPIVGIDGWARIINEHPAFDGMSHVDHVDDKGNVFAITCRMHRKDRSHPIEATEYLAECRRDTNTWKTWPRRMLRHKATIQAARYAFGFSGIYDEDEAERIVASRARDVTPSAGVSGIQARLLEKNATAPINMTEHVEREIRGEPAHDPETGEIKQEQEAKPATVTPEQDGRAAYHAGVDRKAPAGLGAAGAKDWYRGYDAAKEETEGPASDMGGDDFPGDRK